MGDYTKMSDSVAKGDHPVVYLTGPTHNCKSDPCSDVSDQNAGLFDALERSFRAQGMEVLNPARTREVVCNDAGLAIDDPHVWQASLKKDLLLMIETGVTHVIFTPPSHTVASTPDNPELRTWQESSTACLQTMFAFKIGLEFGQAVPSRDGSFAVEAISRDEVREILAQSPTLKELQKDYSVTAIGQRAQHAAPTSSKGVSIPAMHLDEHHEMAHK